MKAIRYWVVMMALITVAVCATAESLNESTLVFSPDLGTDGVVTNKPMIDILDQYLSDKGWSAHENKVNDSPVIVETGIASIGVNLNSPDYLNARINAFNMAFARAKSQMVEYLSDQISTESIVSYTQGDATAFNAPDRPSAWVKLTALLHAKLNRMLENEGVKDKKNVSANEIESMAKSSEEFRKLTRTFAQAMVSGMQVYKIFETQREVGVVAVYSRKLNELAYAVASDTSLPLEAKQGLPIKEQVSGNINALYSSFGTVQMLDENGERMLVAFGQAQPITPSPGSFNMAYRVATTQAKGHLRSFAGESVKITTDLLQAQTVREYENLTASYENQSAYNENIETFADEMNMSGIETVYRWHAKHPLNNAEICGVVLVWSPSRSQQAHDVETRMKNDKPSGAAGNQLDGVVSPSVESKAVNEGLEADADLL